MTRDEFIVATGCYPTDSEWKALSQAYRALNISKSAFFDRAKREMFQAECEKHDKRAAELREKESREEKLLRLLDECAALRQTVESKQQEIRSLKAEIYMMRR